MTLCPLWVYFLIKNRQKGDYKQKNYQYESIYSYFRTIAYYNIFS